VKHQHGSVWWRAGIFVFAAAAGGSCGTNGQAPTPARPPFVVPALDEKVGWYRMPAGDTVLLTYSATGGLRLFSLGDSLYWATLLPGDAGELRAPGADGGVVEWRRTNGGVSGFVWSNAAGERQEAARVADHAYRVEDVAVTVDGTQLSGSLFLPAITDGRVPAAVMIHGSGASDRDNAWYMMIADALVRRGIAVLLPDKRGSGRSGGDWFTTGLSGFARDAAAWQDLVRTHPAIEPARVGLLGLSQGGHIAPMTAATSPAAFVVNISGAAVPLNEQIVHEVAQDMKRDRIPGFLDPVVRRISLATIRRRRPEWWATNGPIDPVEHWRALDVPALVVYGEDDERDNVPVRRSVERLKSLGLHNLDVWVFDGSGHALWEPESTGRIQADGRRRVRPDLLERLANWIHTATT
jgi:pimeloyl-ACP methyl ester carboxylesterase